MEIYTYAQLGARLRACMEPIIDKLGSHDNRPWLVAAAQAGGAVREVEGQGYALTDDWSVIGAIADAHNTSLEGGDPTTPETRQFVDWQALFTALRDEFLPYSLGEEGNILMRLGPRFLRTAGRWGLVVLGELPDFGTTLDLWDEPELTPTMENRSYAVAPELAALTLPQVVRIWRLEFFQARNESLTAGLAP